MYLKQLIDNYKRTGTYPTDCVIKPEELVIADGICDAVLSSWKIAAMTFSMYQPRGSKFPTGPVHAQFAKLVQEVANIEGQPQWAARYPAEIIAFHVLIDWIKERNAQDVIDAKSKV